MNRPGLKTVLAVVKITVSTALLAVLLSRADMRSMLQQFRQMDLAWMAAALAMYGLMLAVSAWRWRLLLQIQTVDVSFKRLTQSFLVATFFNNFLPSNIGGDVVRVADTAPYHPFEDACYHGRPARSRDRPCSAAGRCRRRIRPCDMDRRQARRYQVPSGRRSSSSSSDCCSCSGTLARSRGR